MMVFLINFFREIKIIRILFIFFGFGFFLICCGGIRTMLMMVMLFLNFLWRYFRWNQTIIHFNFDHLIQIFNIIYANILISFWPTFRIFREINLLLTICLH